MAVPQSVVLHINVKTLLVVLLLTATPVLIELVLTVDRTREEHIALTADYLETLARAGAAETARFIEEREREVKLLTLRADFREAARAANRRNRGRGEEEMAAVDKIWQTPETAARVAEVVTGPAAAGLREILRLDPVLERIVVVDRAGAAAAASHKPTLYYHGDQHWRIESFGDGLSGKVNSATFIGARFRGSTALRSARRSSIRTARAWSACCAHSSPPISFPR